VMRPDIDWVEMHRERKAPSWCPGARRKGNGHVGDPKRQGLRHNGRE